MPAITASDTTAADQPAARVFASVKLGLLLIFTSVTAPAAAATTLCTADELTVFSCPVGRHIASVCASKAVSRDQGYLQYRYGNSGKLTMSYPDRTTRPNTAFSQGQMMYSGGGGHFLRFSNGGYTYTVFSATGKWGSGGSVVGAAGVVVAKDGKEAANFPCRGNVTEEGDADLFDRVGLKADDGEEFQIPDAFLPASAR